MFGTVPVKLGCRLAGIGKAAVFDELPYGTYACAYKPGTAAGCSSCLLLIAGLLPLLAAGLSEADLLPVELLRAPDCRPAGGWQVIRGHHTRHHQGRAPLNVTGTALLDHGESRMRRTLACRGCRSVTACKVHGRGRHSDPRRLNGRTLRLLQPLTGA